MTKTTKPASDTIQLDFDLELARDFKENLRFYLKELELVNTTEHVEEIVSEIVLLDMHCHDLKTKAYINRKLKEIAATHPELPL